MTSSAKLGVALLAFSTALHAQTGVLTGTVIAVTKSGRILGPLPEAYVSTHNMTVMSDDTGHFHFDKLPAGKYGISIFHPDFAIMNAESFEVRENQATEMPPVWVFLGDGCTREIPRLVTRLADGKSAVTGSIVLDLGTDVAPLKNKAVELRGERTIRGVTDNDGKYHIEAPPGVYELLADKRVVGPVIVMKGWETHYGADIAGREGPVICV